MGRAVIHGNSSSKKNGYDVNSCTRNKFQQRQLSRARVMHFSAFHYYSIVVDVIIYNIYNFYIVCDDILVSKKG